MSDALNLGETIGAPVQKYADVALPSNPTPRQAAKGDSICDFEYYSGGLCDQDAARQELGVIKTEIEGLIFWRRSGQNQAWWGAEQNQTAARHDAKWRKALADWKSKLAAQGVNVETVLRAVFNSPVGRVWNEDPAVKVLARAWAGVEEN